MRSPPLFGVAFGLVASRLASHSGLLCECEAYSVWRALWQLLLWRTHASRRGKNPETWLPESTLNRTGKGWLSLALSFQVAELRTQGSREKKGSPEKGAENDEGGEK